jgi:hypothetical protein
MNISQIKIWSWGGAAVLTLGLSYYVLDFIRHKEERLALPDPAKAKAVLEGVEQIKAKANDGLGYQDLKRLYSDLNWTGKAVAETPQPTTPAEKPVAVRVPVKDLIKIGMVMGDPVNPKFGSIFLRYRAKAQVQNNTIINGYLLRVGDHLLPPHDKIRLESVQPASATFAFETAEGGTETLGADEFDAKTAIVTVGPDGVIMPAMRTGIPTAENTPFKPGRTTPLGRDRFKIGTEDAKMIAENYSDIIARELKTAQHRDPRTGRYDGIEIKSVVPGSLAASHGAQEGDVIKSINGHAVNSVQEAITFAKNNANKYSIWEIVIENKGKTRTVTYESPDN